MNIDLPWSPSPRVSVIIPATASLDLLLAALRSISRHVPRHIPMETIVVLNASVTEHTSYLREVVNGVVLLSSEVNLGLAGAANRGRSIASGELLVLLHDDAEIEPGWLEALIDAADTHPEAGAVGSKVFFPDGQLQTAGMVLWRDATSSPPWAREPPPSTAFDEARTVDYCGSSSLLVRSEIWDAIGGLDERFYPVYYVDTDLAMSVRQLGRVVLYQPKSRIRHHRSASTSPRWKEFVSARNRRLFIDKWGPALDQHEPADELDEPAAIERATLRAASFVASRSDLTARPRVQPPPAAAYLHKERALLDAYVAHLVERVDDLENRLLLNLAARAETETALETLRADSLYLLGTRLSFATGGEVYRYQFTGGYGAEDWGLWLASEPLRVLLPIARDADAVENQFVLQLDAVPFLAPRRLVSPLRVSVNGETLIELDEARSGEQRYVAFTAPHDCRTDTLIVTIEGADAVTPTSVGLGIDNRPLSVGLVALTIDRV